MSASLFPAGEARFSPCGLYRYTLHRTVGPSPHGVLFVMLNPSTADADLDDPTIRRCKGYAHAWGFGRLTVCNLFALRSTDPRALYEAEDPIGPENDAVLDEEIRRAGVCVAAWGVHGAHLERGEAVRRRLAPYGLWALGFTKDGHPRHPLYLRSDAARVRWA